LGPRNHSAAQRSTAQRPIIPRRQKGHVQARLLAARTDARTLPADKLADYEDELQSLKTSTSSAGGAGAAPPRLAPVPFTSRVVPAAAAAGDARPSTPRESLLQSQLAREQTLRSEAESKVSQLSSEMEELSALLFQQANEMVAAERRARARLEERVEVLEAREREKRTRLERLERAVGRIERVRGLLDSSAETAVS